MFNFFRNKRKTSLLESHLKLSNELIGLREELDKLKADLHRANTENNILRAANGHLSNLLNIKMQGDQIDITKTYWGRPLQDTGVSQSPLPDHFIPYCWHNSAQYTRDISPKAS